ncbi:hypothetical protein BG74_09060 [Sodalis-like endosymbiont of Proechinophthirus fluctus]|nr:hypothetical protein [Sodalis-like endosymbiont of Proechinophthirus fluctus]KYP95429.1 hypothetical protein BG74_09060 [Sodalis-like endosymbiont of Proechinophthirus fluctus]
MLTGSPTRGESGEKLNRAASLAPLNISHYPVSVSIIYLLPDDSSQSKPLTYEVNGKQYVFTTAGRHCSFSTKLEDYIIHRLSAAG